MVNARKIERNWARAVIRGNASGRRKAEQDARDNGLPEIANQLGKLTNAEARRAATRTRS